MDSWLPNVGIAEKMNLAASELSIMPCSRCHPAKIAQAVMLKEKGKPSQLEEEKCLT